MTERKAAPGRRKTSRRSIKRYRPNGGIATKARERWKDPEYRAKMMLRSKRTSEMMRERPQDFFRRGVPDGMRKPEAMRLWAEAREKAKHVMSKMEEAGMVPKVTVPGSDEDKAKSALNEACVLALGPLTDMKIKLGALRTVLEYTKQKPVTKTETKVSAEDFLNSALADFRNDKSDGADTAS